MKLNITTKIVFIIFIVIFSFSGFLGWYFIRHERNALRVELDERIISLTNGLAYNSEYYVLTENKEELARLANKLTEEKDIVYVSIRNQEGSLLAEALKGKAGKEPDEKFTRKVLNYQPEYKGDEELILASPQQLRKKMIGHVSIGFSLASFKKKTLEVKKTILWLLVLTIILPTIIIVSLMNRWIIAPIKKLVLATKKVAQGDLDVTVSLRTKDEMGILADSFNEMVHQLQKSYQALQETRNNLETRATELSKAYEKLKETQTQLIQADKMSAIGTLAGGIAHD
ncbi:MAG: HAMP domain-containing protein, partial [Planctomycetes bacterium]|nr:HAMP domain-containing protein [Planctomycetota bacterium]